MSINYRQPCTHCSRPANIGTPLCETCISDSYNNLHQIARHLRAYHGGSAVHPEPVRRQRATESPALADLHALDFMADAQSLLWYWTRVILDEHPGYRGPDSINIADLCAYVATHLRDLTHNEDAGLAESVPIETQALERRAYYVAHPEQRSRTIALGVHCLENVSVDDPTPCPGRYVAIVKPGSDRLPDLTCDRDPAHTVAPWQFRRIARFADPVALKAIGA